MPLAKMDGFLETHSGELLLLVLFAMIVGTLIVLVPQLLRAHLRKAEMQHEEHLRAIEKGLQVPPPDEASRLAGRAAMLVPMVVLITCGTVTCFLVAYRSESVVAVSLAVWCVGGIVSLAAITGGVALMGRLAQLQTGTEEDRLPENPLGD
jgi:hypothetical protein